MTPEEEQEISAHLRAAVAEARGYADFFGWAIDRNLEEWGVTTTLQEALEAKSEAFFSNVKRRGRGNDPPDCKAIDASGRRVAIETTELVDGRAIERYKVGCVYDWAEWSKEKFLAVLSERISEKGRRFPALKDGPYEGAHVVIVYTDEPALDIKTVNAFLAGHAIARPRGVSRAFLLLSYDPTSESYPYVDLCISG